MTFFALILRNLRYFRKPYLAILAGTVISTAVLTGALIVGDSVRYSLIQLTDVRLGRTRFAVQSGDRFFRQKLADNLSVKTKSPVAPVLQLEGIAVNNDQNSRINRLEVLGMDDRFLKFWTISLKQLADDEALLSQNTAEKLKLKAGDEFLLKIHKQSKASANAPFVSEKQPTVSLRLKVAAIADDSQMGRFSLKSNQAAPYNIFVSLESLADKLELAGNANMLLIADNETSDLSSLILDSLLQLVWQPEDAGLLFRNIPGHENVEIRSDRIFIDDISAKAIQTTLPEATPVFTYLVNAVSAKVRSTPYSFVTAADPGQSLTEKQIIINDWLAADLAVKPGDSIQLRYFKMGAMRKLTEDSSRFCIKAVLPVSDPLFDRTLMPDFPGMSDAGNCRDWETGAPVNLDKIRDKDEQYWNDYRGTPKAFISLAAGRKLWDNAFGHATAIRFRDDSNVSALAKKQLMQKLKPEANGLNIQDVYSEGKHAATNSIDFGSLFLSLSFFIVAAAILLIALLFSLHAQKRMSETAILASIGFHKKQIIRILFTEATFVVVAGSIIGVVFGVYYNELLLLGLNTLWQDAVRTTSLQMHLVPVSLLVGFTAGIITALTALLVVLVRNLRQPLSVMVRGVVIPSPNLNRCRKKTGFFIAFLLFGIAFSLVVYSFLSSGIDISELFLSAGGMIMAGGIFLLYALLLQANQRTCHSQPDLIGIILKNISLKKSRTITAVALLAIGTFSVIITGANRKTFYGLENHPESGTGGFLFWTETTVPLLYDLNSAEGKEKYGLTDETSLDSVRFTQMLSRDGNDASCLNLNQVSQPKILGIDADYFGRRNTFSFVNTDQSVNKLHPWLALNNPLGSDVIPAFADQTVIQWGLQKKIGDTLLYRDESGKILKVKLIGGLDNSVFQGHILISAKLFMQYFPSAAGSRFMLVNGDFSKKSEIAERLEFLFQDYGMVVTPASERLADFNSVENTYLSVFMLLGGLGVILGTFGLGIVILRSISERRQEIALYLAIGFKLKFVCWILAAEYLLILLSGIFIGTFSAIIALLPAIYSSSQSLPIMYLVTILTVILFSGLLWIFFPVKKALKQNLVEVLRLE